ncbi:hypothetical protein J3A83DRAFT_4190516 [Scleroderma citrinum]
MDIPLGDIINCDLQVFKKGIKYCSNFFRSFCPAVWVIILDMCTKMKNVMHIELSTTKSCTSFNSCAIAFLTELETLLVEMGQPIKNGLKVLLLVMQERQLCIHSMKEHAIAPIDDPKKSSLGGLALKDKAIMPKELRAHIMAILGIQSYDEEVKSIDFTGCKKRRQSQLDLYLLHVPISSKAFHSNMIIKEEHSQMWVLKHFCESSSAEVVKFNQQLSTRDGTDGWRVKLTNSPLLLPLCPKNPSLLPNGNKLMVFNWVLGKDCLEEYLMAGLEEKVDIVSELVNSPTIGSIKS